jgi:hypothetical protein
VNHDSANTHDGRGRRHRSTAGNAQQLTDAGSEVVPVVNGQHRDSGIDRAVRIALIRPDVMKQEFGQPGSGSGNPCHGGASSAGHIRPGGRGTSSPAPAKLASSRKSRRRVWSGVRHVRMPARLENRFGRGGWRRSDRAEASEDAVRHAGVQTQLLSLRASHIESLG